MPGLLVGVTRLGSGCVFLRTRSDRGLLPSIYPSLLRDGVTLWVECGFPPTRSKLSFLWITGRFFLQDGVTLFGPDSCSLISIEGITSIGLLGVFFRAVLGMFGHPVVIRWALKSGGVSTFSCLHLWCGLCVYPSRQRRSESWPFSCWPCCLSPSPRGSVCFGSHTVFSSPGRFSCMGIPRMVAR